MSVMRLSAWVMLILILSCVCVGCSSAFWQGVSYGQTPEYKQKTEELANKLKDSQSALLNAKDRVLALSEILKEAKEQGFGIETIAKITAQYNEGREDVEKLLAVVGDVRGEAEELKAMVDKTVPGQDGAMYKVGAGDSTLISLGLIWFGGGKLKIAGKLLSMATTALHSVVEGVDKLDLDKDQRKILSDTQSGHNIRTFVDDVVVTVRKKKKDKEKSKTLIIKSDS